MELINAISESGVLIAIAGVFLYTYISDKKNNKERDEIENRLKQEEVKTLERK